MTKVIIDSQSGTVVPLDYCYVVDLSELDENDAHFLDVASDSEISQMAVRTGKSVLKIMEDTLYGEVTRFTSVSYSPGALRDEAEVLLELEYDTTEERLMGWLKWVTTEATDEELKTIGELCIGTDDAWNGYRTIFTSNLFYYFTEVVIKGNKG